MIATAHATVDGERILVRTLKDGDFEQTKAACKKPRGARWQPSTKQWAYPLTVEVCHDLRAAFGQRLMVLAPLADWYRQALAAQATQSTLADEDDAVLHRVPTLAPRLAGTLRADQRAAAAWVASGYRGAGLLADEPGTGKTLVTIAGILEAGTTGAILVTCPRLSVKRVWQRELKKWAPDESVHICRGTRAKREKAIAAFMADDSERKWLITVTETLRVKAIKSEAGRYNITGYEYPDLFEKPWAWVVVDESHKAFGSLTIVKGTLMGLGIKVVGQHAERRLAVTGSPFGKGGRLTGMFGTLMWLWPDEFTSYWRWVGTYFNVEEEEVYIKGGYGRTRTVRKVGDLRQGSEEDFLKEFGPRIRRRLLTEVMPWLPTKRYQEVICEMEGMQLKQYRELSVDAEVVVDGGVISADGVLAEITRAKQLADGALRKDEDGNVKFVAESSCKIDNFLEVLETRGILENESQTKVLVASQYNEFLDAVGARLTKEDVSYLLMTGKTSDAERDRLMDTFQDPGGPAVFLINSKAGGVSVTLDAADEVHCLDELWDPGDQEQLEGRAQRASRAPTPAHAGVRPPVLIVQYRTEGTLDTNIGDTNEERRQNQHTVLDGRRGIAYVRDVIRYRKPADN